MKNPVGNSRRGFVIPTRFERVTHSLEGCCSIQLSYGTIKIMHAVRPGKSVTACKYTGFSANIN